MNERDEISAAIMAGANEIRSLRRQLEEALIATRRCQGIITLYAEEANKGSATCERCRLIVEHYGATLP